MVGEPIFSLEVYGYLSDSAIDGYEPWLWALAFLLLVSQSCLVYRSLCAGFG